MARTTWRLAPTRGGSSTTRSAPCRRHGAAPGRPGRAPTAPRGTPPGCACECREARPVALDGHDRPVGPDRLGEERREQPDPGVQVERPTPPAAGRASRARTRPASRGAATCGCQKPSAGDLELVRRRCGGARPARPRAAGLGLAGVRMRRSGTGRSPRRRASGACAGRDATVGQVRRTASGCARPGRRRAAPPRPSPRVRGRRAAASCSAPRPAFSRRCSASVDVLEVAAAAEPRPGVRAGRRDPVGRRRRAPRPRRREGSARRPR